MKKSMFFAALAAMSLASCSNDEVVELQQDEITFSVVADNAARGAVTTTNDLAEFMVYGYAGGAGAVKTVPYANGEKAVKKGSGKFGFIGTWFWPIEDNLDFFCFAPVEGVTYDNKTIKDFAVNADITKQIDLIYAVAKDQNKADDKDSGVKLNFRHALSQVAFQVKSLSSVGLAVKVNSITVANLNSKGTLAYAEESTEKPAAGDTEVAGEGWGKWTLTADKADFSTGALATALTVAPDDKAVAASEALLLMPQALTPATPGTWTDGAYFLIDCAISKDNVKLWPASTETDGFGTVAIPAGELTWKQGMKYVYTFIFGQGGGYEPGTDNPVLVPIDFEVTVDAFQDIAGSDIDMKAE